MNKLKKGTSNYVAAIIFIGIITIIASCSNNKPAQQGAVKKDTVAATATADSTHLVGMWLDEEIKTDSGDQVAYQIVTKGPKTFIQVVTFKEKKLSVNDNPEISPGASEVRKEKNKYISLENDKDIYLVENSGDLLIYDATGFIAKCKKML